MVMVMYFWSSCFDHLGKLHLVILAMFITTKQTENNIDSLNPVVHTENKQPSFTSITSQLATKLQPNKQKTQTSIF